MGTSISASSTMVSLSASSWAREGRRLWQAHAVHTLQPTAAHLDRQAEDQAPWWPRCASVGVWKDPAPLLTHRLNCSAARRVLAVPLWGTPPMATCRHAPWPPRALASSRPAPDGLQPPSAKSSGPPDWQRQFPPPGCGRHEALQSCVAPPLLATSVVAGPHHGRPAPWCLRATHRPPPPPGRPPRPVPPTQNGR